MLALAELLRLDKPYGTLLLLWPSLWALTIASGGRPTVGLVATFCLGAFVMRSAGCAVNDLADRRLDARVDRTKDRPLASGRLTPADALAAITLLLALAALLLWPLPPLTRWLSLPAVALTALYPFMKRVFPAPQLVLGAAFGWGVPMAWSAVHNRLDPTAWLLFFATLCWATAYDTIYALMDLADDERAGIHSTARLFGHWNWLAIALLGAAMLALLAAAGRRADLHLPFSLALGAVALLFFYQAARVRMGIDRHAAFRLFRAHVGVGLIVLLGIELDYVVRYLMVR